MSELGPAIREALIALAASDPTFRRFGAAHHRYELAPPLAHVDLDIEDVRELATTLGSGGAGPYYGWLPLDRALRFSIAAPPGVTGWRRAIPLAHLGCGYAAILPLDGEARGQVWLDARAVGVVRPIHASFTAFYLDWIDRLLRSTWPEHHVVPGACALPSAVSGYLGAWEQEHGLSSGTLAGEDLREALSQLGRGAIEIGAEGPLFAAGDRADPCIACARLLDNLGLRPEVVAPGVPPLAVR